MDLVQLKQLLMASFNLDEVQSLCFDLGITYENLPGSTLDAKCRELLDFCRRTNRLPELVALCQVLRPAMSWPQIQPATKHEPSGQPAIGSAAQDALLQEYTDQMTEFLLVRRLASSRPTDPLRAIARTKTLTALRKLDADRRNEVIRFLRDSQLIGQEENIVSLRNADLRGVDLANIDLEHIDLAGADLRGANLQGANLREVNLEEAKLDRANLKAANLEQAALGGASLEAASLQDGYLWAANLIQAKLTGADLRGADLQDAGLSRANLQDANLQGAKLHYTSLDGAYLHDADLQGADLDHANLRGAYCARADFRRANLKKASLEGADLKDANFEGATLHEANFTRRPPEWWHTVDPAFGKDAELQGANLQGADLHGATISAEQLAACRSLKSATLPDGTKHP